MERRAALSIVPGADVASVRRNDGAADGKAQAPFPSAFVVKKGSKIRSIFSSGMLPPRSVTDTFTALSVLHSRSE